MSEVDTKKIAEFQDRVREAVIELMDLDPANGWQQALSVVYDLRWQYVPEEKKREPGAA